MIIGDGIVHVKSLNILYVMVIYMYTCFTILKSPILHVHFLQNLSTINVLDPFFIARYSTIFANELHEGARCEKVKGKPTTLKRSSKCKTWRFCARCSPLGVGS